MKKYILQVNYQLLYDNEFHGNCSHFTVHASTNTNRFLRVSKTIEAINLIDNQQIP